MLENAIFSVITPEGAASILWKDKDKAKEAAAALQMTAVRLLTLGLIDGVVPEPLGGAHRDPAKVFVAVKDELVRRFRDLDAMSDEERCRRRYARYRAIGRFHTAPPPVESTPPEPQA
jgi:acetyl-CoA carboxylase carboxyl transferase subunit alpha